MKRPLAAARLSWQTRTLRPLAPTGRLLHGPLRSPHLMPDPEGRYTIHWSSPADSLLQLTVTCHAPGKWLGLHIPFRSGLSKAPLVFAIDSQIAPPAVMTPVLRIPQRHGLTDHFATRPILGHPQGGIETGVIAAPPARLRWQEWILFLPPDRDFVFALGDLRFGRL